jgi:mycothiol maleylpyruvate isomerase-like protein
MHDAYLEAADSVLLLLSRPEVTAAWSSPSALPEWSVGGLAGHLAGQLTTPVRLLATPYADEELIPLHEHYLRAAWVSSTVNDDVNVSIRQGGAAAAADGPEALISTAADAVTHLRGALLDQPSDRRVAIPWQGWALTLDDFLVTRMMEIAVHSDDLAVSVGVTAPPLSQHVLRPVLALLTDLAVRRHGQSAVIRALTRRERAPESVVAF